MTINRFCSSGLQAVALAADRIRLGEADVMIAAGTESMSMIPMGGNKPSFSPHIFDRDENIAIGYGMGITAEKVAQQWNVTREEQDLFAAESHRRAVAATDSGEFTRRDHALYDRRARARSGAPRNQARQPARDGATKGRARDTSPEALAKLRPVFAAQGQRDGRQQFADVGRRRRGRADERGGDEALQPAAAGALSRATRWPACRPRSWASGRSRRSPRC